MFDIKIGTVISANLVETVIPELNSKGFECYELGFDTQYLKDIDTNRYAETVRSVIGDREISSIGYYGNPIMNPEDGELLKKAILTVKALGGNVVGTFAGGDPSKSVPDNIPGFVKAWTPIAEFAEKNGIKIGFEACGNNWDSGCRNIGFCPAGWELMFDALPSDALGLEWEPAHAIGHLADPVAQLRRWAKKVVHLHGKDGTVAWDVVRDYGIRSGREWMWHRTPGFGDTNWADLFTILLQNGFEGACDIEGYHDPVHYDDMEWAAQLTALDYLKRCRGGIDFYYGPSEQRGYQGKRKK